MRFLSWLFRAAVFFILFAFALNNQHEAQLKWFFGFEFRAPMVLLVLVVFAAGAVFGVLAMTPNWWRQRRRRHATRASVSVNSAADKGVSVANLPVVPDVPLSASPRDGI
ncbi:lipopolysaccharide assembly LapA domain-containing protein [Sphaerotilus sp.]|uniref:LapA family protein n=1 Tax=Sphaerotilus sp. TaxID=2093942 RepID=UPI0034E23796